MSQPFSRAIAMMAAIASAMQLDGSAKHLAMSRIGQYESRGKGKGRRQASSNTAAQVKRNSIKSKNVSRNRSLANG